MSMYILQDGLVSRVTGIRNCISFGNYRASWYKDEIVAQLESIESYLTDPTSDVFKTTIVNLGRDLFSKMTETDQIRDIYTQLTDPVLKNKLSISFTIDKKLNMIPVEMLREKTDPVPLAAKYPLYKTAPTPTDYYTHKEPFDPVKANILLVSSCTSLSDEAQEWCIGDEVQKKNRITLESVDELEDDGNEIETIVNILDQAKAQRKWDGEYCICRTEKLTYDQFLKFIGSDKYDIIHYNGHGCSSRRNNLIFFWENQNGTGRIKALNNEKINSELLKTTNLKFVYLSCCQSATAATGDNTLFYFNDMLHSVVEAGVPYALGMRWPIPIDNSKLLAKTFYHNLFLNGAPSIETALQKTRYEYIGYQDQSIWCTPILLKQDFT